MSSRMLFILSCVMLLKMMNLPSNLSYLFCLAENWTVLCCCAAVAWMRTALGPLDKVDAEDGLMLMDGCGSASPLGKK
jgi:hypothetical protein